MRGGKSIRMVEYENEIQDLIRLRKKAPDGSDWAKSIDNRLAWLLRKVEKANDRHS